LNQIAALRRGNEKAFIEVYNQFHVKLFRYLAKKSHSNDTAKELTQQTFIKLWQSRFSLSELHPIDSQCFTIANSVLIDHLRKQATERKYRTRSAIATNSEMLFASHAVKEFESSDYLKAATESLPPARKNVFILKIIKGYSNKEIAEQLSISVKTVEDHYSKAIRHIRTTAIETFFLFILSIVTY
jgi:RNA polymerase sigma-19 factor, ECF subfamily